MRCAVKFFEPKPFFDLHIELLHLEQLTTNKTTYEEKKKKLCVPASSRAHD
jgi:hypothetical protein